jgi:starch synthase (maltosyl-transferring)
VAVNLDPFEAHDARLRLPLERFGLAAEDRLQAHELITDQRQIWRGPTHTIRLDPAREPAAIFRVVPFTRTPFAELY